MGVGSGFPDQRVILGGSSGRIRLAVGMKANAKHEPPSNADPSNLFCFYRYLAGRNLTRTTGYRYRQQGIIKVIINFGRLYITREEIERFERRALNGEFCKSLKQGQKNAL